MQKIFKETQAGTSEALQKLPHCLFQLISTACAQPGGHWRDQSTPRTKAGSCQPDTESKKKAKSFKALNKDPVSLISSVAGVSLPDSVRASQQTNKMTKPELVLVHSPEATGCPHQTRASTPQWELHGNYWLLVQPVQCSVKLRMDTLQFLG